jgi:hypothetical protein
MFEALAGGKAMSAPLSTRDARAVERAREALDAFHA